MKLRRNEMKLRRNRFSPTWRIKNSHVEILKSLRGYRIKPSDYGAFPPSSLWAAPIGMSRWSTFLQAEAVDEV